MDYGPHHGASFVNPVPDNQTSHKRMKENMLNLNLQSWYNVAPGSSDFSSSRNSEPCHDKENGCPHKDGSQGSTLHDEGLSLTLGFTCISKPFETKPNSPNEKPFISDVNTEADERTHSKHLDLGLGLMTSSPCDLMNNYLGFSKGLISREDALAGASLGPESATIGWYDVSLEADNGARKPNGSEYSLGGSESVSVAVKSFSAVHANDDSEVDLQLGLSGSSVTLESNVPLDMPVGTRDVQLTGTDMPACDHIPVVDEGSTSARLIKSGGYMTKLLQGRSARVNASSNLSQMSKMALDSTSCGDANIASVHGGVSFSGFNAQTVSSSNHGVTSERSSKMCKFRGCIKGARGASGLCIAHGGGRRCQRPNCNKGAEGRTMFCKAHGGGRRCQTLGCIKSAEGKTDFCIAHGGGRRCIHEGCSKAARGRSGLCIRHGGGKRCQKEGCTKSAEGFSGLCISHGGGRRCQFPGCGKGAQGSTKFCKAHGGGRRCEFEGCTKGAEGSTPLCKAHGGGKRCTFGGGTCSKSVHGGTLFCVAHGGGKRCAAPACTKSARGRTDFCVRHGGGKRCKVYSCSKSAQGSTDFCKAHGGGKRCSWGQEGSMHDGSVGVSCDKFARGRTGLCSSHSVIAERWEIPGTSTLNLQGSKSTSLYSSPFSDLSDQTFQLGDENSVDTGSHHSPSDTDFFWRPDNCQTSNTMIFKAQGASRCIATEGQGLIIGNRTEPWNPFPQPSTSTKVVNFTTHGPYAQGIPQHMQLYNNYLPATPSTEGVGATSEKMQNLWKGNTTAMSSIYDPEERVHGGGHFMALLASKTTRDDHY